MSKTKGQIIRDFLAANPNLSATQAAKKLEKKGVSVGYVYDVYKKENEGDAVATSASPTKKLTKSDRLRDYIRENPDADAAATTEKFGVASSMFYTARKQVKEGWVSKRGGKVKRRVPTVPKALRQRTKTGKNGKPNRRAFIAVYDLADEIGGIDRLKKIVDTVHEMEI